MVPPGDGLAWRRLRPAPSSERRSSPTRSPRSSRRRRASCCGPGSAPTRPTPTGLVAADPELTDIVASGSAATTADRDHTVVVDVGGLAPATSYWYRFSAGGEDSPVGRTRTLPAGPVDSFRIGTVSCAHYAIAPLGVYRALAEREVDLVLHLGDYLYEDDGHDGPRDHDPPHAAVTQDDYRRRLAQLRADPDLQALHLRHPMIAIWDDHDLADNAWREGAKRHDPGRDGPWAVRVASAAAARQEWIPARLRDRLRPEGGLAVRRHRRPGRAGAPRLPVRRARPAGRLRRRTAARRQRSFAARGAAAALAPGAAGRRSRGHGRSSPTASSSTRSSCRGPGHCAPPTACSPTGTPSSTGGSCTTTSGTAIPPSAGGSPGGSPIVGEPAAEPSCCRPTCTRRGRSSGPSSARTARRSPSSSRRRRCRRRRWDERTTRACGACSTTPSWSSITWRGPRSPSAATRSSPSSRSRWPASGGSSSPTTWTRRRRRSWGRAS